MKNITLLSVLLASIGIAHAVPTAINYQGRLTDGDGNPASGSKLFSLSLYDAATAGNELYTETIGSIAVDENGIYNFQFGANGTSTVAEAETLAVTDGSSTVYTATPSTTPIAGTLSVSDGTYSWNEVDGNPGELATATTQLGNGFVIGYAVTNGGEGYTIAPVVTINGDGIGATATAEVTNGVVTAINVGDVGSGYTNATVSIAEPPAPFVVDYSAGELTFTYEAAPSAGVQITASYDANDTSIVGALSAADAHWLELSIDGDIQSPRERILSVPFAQVAGSVVSEDYQSKIDKLTGEIAHLIPRSISKPVLIEIDRIREIPVNSRFETTITLQTYVRTFILQHNGGNNTFNLVFNYHDGSSETVISDSDVDYSEPVPDPNRNTWDWDIKVWGENPHPEKLISSVVTDGLRPSDGFRFNITSVTLEAVESHVLLFEFGETLSSGEWVVGYEDDDLHSKNEYGDIFLRLEDNNGITIVRDLKQGSRFHLDSNTYVKDVAITASLAENPNVEKNSDPKIKSVSFYKVK